MAHGSIKTLLQVDRFGDESVQTRRLELAADLRQRVRSQGDHLDRTQLVARPEHLEDLRAFVQRHVGVEDDQGVVAAAAHVDRTVAVRREGHGVALGLEKLTQKLRVVLIVLSDQDAGGCHLAWIRGPIVRLGGGPVTPASFRGRDRRRTERR